MNRRIPILGLLVVGALALGCAERAVDGPHSTSAATGAPKAKTREHVETRHGRNFSDPWFWLREKENPDVTAYLDAENAYTEAMTAPLAPFRETLYREMLGRIVQTDVDPPVRRGRFAYYQRTIEGKQYPLRCRRPVDATGREIEGSPEEVLLDQNAMAEGKPYLGIGVFTVADDDQRLAYSVDETGFRQYVLRIRDLRTGKDFTDTAERVTSAQWSADANVLYFVTEDAVTKRSNVLWRLELGKPPVAVYEEKDELFRLGLRRSKDKSRLFLSSRSTDTHEIFAMAAAEPHGEFRSVLGRRKGTKYTVEHRDGAYYVRTNDRAKNYRVLVVPATDPGGAEPEELVPHRPDALLDDFEVYATHAVATVKSAGLTQFHVHDFAAGTWRELRFPEAAYAASGMETPEFASTSFRLRYESMVTPPGIYDCDFASLERTLRKEEKCLGYDASGYVTERLWATARDGVKVPISLVRKATVKRHGGAPLWLYGYGSYGIGEAAEFSSANVSLLDRGVVYAIAHVRGGDEMGESWHDDGMLMKKMNTFTDFIDCAEFLAREGWAAPKGIAIEGGSAGGLLMGAVANLRPDLFTAVHLAVPFVDVMNTMLDASLPLTVGEYLEWGNPNERAAFDYMLSYSPYDNIERKAYPAMLVTTSFNDSQVMYWEPAKYVAKMRAMRTDANDLHFRCKMQPAGHGGASGRYDRLKDRAFEFAWMLAKLGIDR